MSSAGVGADGDEDKSNTTKLHNTATLLPLYGVWMAGECFYEMNR